MAIEITVKIPVEDALRLQESFIKASGATQAQMTEVLIKTWTEAMTSAFANMTEQNMKAMMSPFFALGKNK